MDAEGTQRLREEQYHAIEDTEAQLAQLQTYIDDYVCVRDRLKTLPDKVKHEVMVPFGKFAFMPGHLVHTNEVLVLLGDNWFCERSAKQASQIADRRLQGLEKQQEDLRKQQRLLEPRLDFTTQLQHIMEPESGVVEIKEEYDPDTEKIWREQHRKNLRHYKQHQRANQDEAPSPRQQADQSQLSSHTDADIWRRLDELELQERRNREMAKMSDETEADISAIPDQSHDPARRVKWGDEEGTVETSTGGQKNYPVSREYSSSDENSESSGEDDSSNSVEHEGRPRIIYISHTDTSHTTEGATREPPQEGATREPPQEGATREPPQEGATPPLLQSPGDIYTQFVEPMVGVPRSILKQPSETFSLQPDLIPKRPHVVEHTVTESGEPEAFTGQILEKSSTIHTDEVDCSHKPLESSSVHDLQCSASNTQQAPKKMSRFKARQMQKHS